jgi:hypothetical protein
MIDATGHDPGEVTCDQTQSLSTGSLQCIAGSGQHDGGMGGGKWRRSGRVMRDERWSTLGQRLVHSVGGGLVGSGS